MPYNAITAACLLAKRRAGIVIGIVSIVADFNPRTHIPIATTGVLTGFRARIGVVQITIVALLPIGRLMIGVAATRRFAFAGAGIRIIAVPIIAGFVVRIPFGEIFTGNSIAAGRLNTRVGTSILIG
jgi:NADH:ubiquinone oxidoreductase subunit H